ncbi:MAG: class I SAM-dependent rRNA methyltransferase [Leptospiraceae bacterium]|nr:class I SAM-dependent rRNA methyltransferase [Leptospiraceae bacterium]MDW7976258.1 class I SAM-dependent rRNA methyltransferase [Leptospiraceae bacterium]
MVNSLVNGRLYIKSGKDELLKNFHSWIFSGAVEKLEAFHQKLRNGEIIEIYNSYHEFQGYAFYEKQDQIVARIFYFGGEQIRDFDAFFYEKFQKIYERKKKLFLDSNAFRFLHSESDGIPGIVCDIYHHLAVIQIDFLESKYLIGLLVNFLKEQNIQYILLKRKENIEWITEEIPTVEFVENGLKIKIDLDKFLKTGYFLDQRWNRRKLQFYVKDKVVLDAFCYVGSFGLHALKYEAKKVDLVDSKNLISIVKENMFQNGFYLDQFEFFRENVLEYLQRVPKNLYDVIVLDPPAFVKKKIQYSSGVRGYLRLNQLALEKIKSQGWIFTFSCSQFVSKEDLKKIIFLSAREAKRKVYIVEYLTQSPDHTISIYHPEGEYLKGMVLYVEE